MAPARGIMDVGLELEDFFLIFCEAMISERRYFLNKLSKAARASLDIDEPLRLRT